MAGSKSGVSTKLRKEESCAVYGAINLAVSGVMKKNRLTSDTLNITLEIYKLFEILISSCCGRKSLNLS